MSISLMQAVRTRSPNSPPERYRAAADERRYLTSRFALRDRAVQQIDEAVSGFRLRKIDSALKSRLDEATDDLCPADRLAMFQTDVDGKSVEIGDMTVEQNDRNFRPGLGVYNGATSIAFSWTHTFSLLVLNSRPDSGNSLRLSLKTVHQ